MYSAGLRVSELLNLKVCDLEIDKGYGFVRSGKGGKDRLFILSEKFKERISELIYNNGLKGDNLLFLSNRDRKYNVRSMQEIIRKACKKAGIEKKVHPHTLRHSFATHLIENGYSVSEVQGLLGHKSPETTMIYLHTATKSMLNIKSPIDSL
jgi:site-specific recombinase XerD